MEIIPKEILREIVNYLSLINVIRLRKVNKYLNKNIKVIDLVSMDIKLKKKLNDEIISKYVYLEKLECLNMNITNISNLVNLRVLSINEDNCKIDQEGIQNLINLEALYVTNNERIKDIAHALPSMSHYIRRISFAFKKNKYNIKA